MSLSDLTDVYGNSLLATDAEVKENIEGLHVKSPVTCGTTANIDLTNPGATIDGVSLTLNDRVLVLNQTDQKQNGIYVWTAGGATMIRASDFNDSSNVVPGSYVHVNSGTVHANNNYVLTNTGTVVVDTDNIVFALFSSVTSPSDVETLTNKTIDADLNTLSNIANAQIKAGAAIDASKLGTGVVSNTEFDLLNGLTSIVDLASAQTLTNKTINGSNNTFSNIDKDVMIWGSEVMITDSYTTPGSQATCVGNGAGAASAGAFSVLVGGSAGNSASGTGCVGLGYTAGAGGLGDYSIAVGYRACHPSSGHDNAIVLNGTGSGITTTANSQFIVKPVRDVAPNTNSLPLNYENSTGEITKNVSMRIPENLYVHTSAEHNNVYRGLYLGEAAAYATISAVCGKDGIQFYPPDENGGLIDNQWLVSGVGTNSALYFHWRTGVTTAYGIINQAGTFFTGQHSGTGNPNTLNATENLGLIIEANGTYRDTININDAHPNVVLTTTNNSKKVYGVISNLCAEEGAITPNQNRYYDHDAKSGHFANDITADKIRVNSIGEGSMYVCDINGSLANGDYVTSCTVPGYGMLQNDDILHNYTVAKILQDCDFSSPDRYVKANGEILADEAAYNAYGGAKYKCCFVGVTYHCG